MIKYMLSIMLLCIFVIGYVSGANAGYDYLDHGEEVQTGSNYTINTNYSLDSDKLDGFHFSSFFPFANISSFLTTAFNPNSTYDSNPIWLRSGNDAILNASGFIKSNAYTNNAGELGIFTLSDNSMTFYTNGSSANSQRLKLTPAGDLAFGRPLVITGYSTRRYHFNTDTVFHSIRMTDATTGTTANDGFDLIQVGNNIYLVNRENGFISYYTNALERMRLTEAGNLLLRTTIDSGYTLGINGTLGVSTNATINNSLTVSGNITGNLYYGEMWNNTDSGFETVDLVTPDVYVKVNKLNCGSLNGFTCVNGNLTNTLTGMYKIDVVSSISAVSGTGEFGMKVFIDEVGQNHCYAHSHLTTDVHNSAITCLVRLTGSNRTTIRFDDHANPVRDVVVDAMNVNIMRVGN